MEAPDAPDNRIYIYDRTAILDLVRHKTREVVEFYDPASDITFNLVDGAVHAWRGRENLDRVPTPIANTTYFTDIAKMQCPRNVRRGPPLTHAERWALTMVLSAEERLKEARAQATTAFGFSWIAQKPMTDDEQ